MKVLLDTQVFIWLVNDNVRLGRKSKQLIVATRNQVFLSYMSFFEMTIKASIGKLKFDPAIMDDLEKMGIELIRGDFSSLANYQIYNKKNKDPFDNFLISIARIQKLRFITSDHKILATKVDGLEVFDASK